MCLCLCIVFVCVSVYVYVFVDMTTCCEELRSMQFSKAMNVEGVLVTRPFTVRTSVIISLAVQ